jgi:hypothetical protein
MNRMDLDVSTLAQGTYIFVVFDEEVKGASAFTKE